MIKACIFDLDGTVMDTLRSIAYFVNYTLEKLGAEPIDVDEFRYMAGSGRAVLLHKALAFRDCDTPELFEKACEIYDRAYEGDFMHLTRPFDGIKEAVIKLHEKGIKTAVLSNKPDNVTHFIVEKVFGKSFFDAVCGQCDGMPIKPDPTGFLKLAGEFDVLPEECVMIGDTNIDIKTGSNAGAHTVGVLWGFRTRDELIVAGAEALAAAPGELAEIIKIF
ncbi:MAG: HAD family hydrolase [Clostridia bacterium]|nr:HAD family hydrolase [Clostridia bacterium]